MSRVQIARNQIAFARDYTVKLLDTIPTDDWFKMPGGYTHVAWQVGHLAMAEFLLGNVRLRGPRPDDANLLPPEFITIFGRESIPDPSPAKHPPISVIRSVFDRVHQETMQLLADFPENDLDSEVLKPHPICKTKWDALMWCAGHELTHAGQLGMIRRLFGMKFLW